jgi:hypothetical protein
MKLTEYGDIAFAIVCTFWCYDWIEGRVKAFIAWRKQNAR